MWQFQDIPSPSWRWIHIFHTQEFRTLKPPRHSEASSSASYRLARILMAVDSDPWKNAAPIEFIIPLEWKKWRNTSSPTDVDLLSWAYHPSARENGLPLVRLVGFAGKSNMTERIRQKVRQRSAWNRRTLVAGLHSNSQPLWYQLFHGFSKRYWMLW